MKIIAHSSPHLKRPNARVVRMMRDVVIALLPLVIFAIYNHGLTALWIMLAAVLSMVGTEYIYYQIHDLINKEKFKLKNKNFTLYNYSVLISGLIYGLTIPDATPILVVIIGGVIAVLLIKLIFGGLGQNIFNIAAFGRAFIALSFGGAVAVSNLVDADAGATVLTWLAQSPFSSNITDHYSFWDMFSGIGFPGSIGETSGLLIIVGGIYLGLRKSFDAYVPLVYVGTVFILALAVMIQKDLGIWYPLTHVLSGGLLFGAVYMATDPITIPITRPGRIYFAFGLGVLTFVIRLFGAYPEGVVFSLLIMNAFVPAIDFPTWSKNKFSLKSCLIFAAIVLLAIVAVMVGVQYV